MGSGCSTSSLQKNSIQNNILQAQLEYLNIHLEFEYKEYPNNFLRQQIKSKQATGLPKIVAPNKIGCILQCISGCLPLVDYLLSDISDFTPTDLTSAFSILLSTQWKKNYQVIVPKLFLSLLTQQLSESQSLSDLFDSFLNIMVQNFKRYKIFSPANILKIEEDEKKAAYYWQQNLMQNCSIFTDLFTGQIKLLKVCSRCLQVSESYRVFSHLKLKIPEVSNPNLEDCIQLFENKEKEQRNFWCERCKQIQHAYYKRKLWKLPIILAVSLQGYQNKKGVRFPLEDLDLNRFIKRQKYEPKYNLFGKIDYQSQKGYLSKIKINHSWFMYKQNSVSEISTDFTLKGQAHLLFFYQISAQKILKQTPRLIENWPHYIKNEGQEIQNVPFVSRLKKCQRKFLKGLSMERSQFQVPFNYFQTQLRHPKDRVIELNKQLQIIEFKVN